MSYVDKAEARTWSKDRINQQIAVLRGYMEDAQQEISELEDKINDLETNPQYEMSNSREDRISGASDAVARLNKEIGQIREDIQYLISLL